MWKFDKKRTEYLEQYGIKVIRISNLEVLKNFEGVCMYIDNAVKQVQLRLPWCTVTNINFMLCECLKLLIFEMQNVIIVLFKMKSAI